MGFQLRKLEYTKTVQELKYLIGNFDVSTKEDLFNLNFHIQRENVRINDDTGSRTLLGPIKKKFPQA